MKTESNEEIKKAFKLPVELKNKIEEFFAKVEKMEIKRGL